MSFMGSIGKLMKGSGLEELLETVYGENTVQHIMMTGKAVSRALRGHFLAEAALMNNLISNFIPHELQEEENVESNEIEHPEKDNDEESNTLEEQIGYQESGNSVSTDNPPPVSSENILKQEEIQS